MFKVTKLTILNYQRNGVTGDGFYVASVYLSDSPNDGLIATFQLEPLMSATRCESTLKLETDTCRVIDVNDLQLAWRGDAIGWDIASVLMHNLKKANAFFTCTDDQCNCEGKSRTVYDLIGKELEIPGI